MGKRWYHTGTLLVGSLPVRPITSSPLTKHSAPSSLKPHSLNSSGALASAFPVLAARYTLLGDIREDSPRRAAKQFGV